ncbi:Gfo/Idh/MocA family oxidoreductase [Halomicroarcula sp. F13]|uniref:Gfo/Idh/MocA family oxidoreductase n=1 Tax=Haloarcula rubra TaxID=2487747 RepID=A0AAW4PPS8_9EURY|nr:Gfo/Idh/MocA family oxidoreductase [Halomicroarcula rubra]MBX0323166.1 Gfo/Idh/MocA family oxidoreductase [Halomicroarcula rubra]
MRYGVVGTGYWGKNHVRVARELLDEGRLDEVVICDTDERRVESLADSYDLPYVTDVAEMDVDAATVATPSTTHRAIGTDMLERGIDLLVEKPLALNAEDAWHLVETAEDNGCSLGVGHIFRYHPALRALKRRVDRGELGRIKYLQTRRFSFRVPRRTTGVLYSLAVHDVDVYDYLLDARPDTVHGRFDSFVREGIVETSTLTLGYGNVTGVINSSWQIPVFDKTRDLVVVGSNRSAYIDYLENTKLELFDAEVFSDPEDGLKSRNDGAIVHTTDDEEPLKTEVEAFVDACESGEHPPASGAVGARAVETLEHAERSAAKNEVVTVDRPGLATQF